MFNTTPTICGCVLLAALSAAPSISVAQEGEEEGFELVQPGIWGTRHVDERAGSWFTPGNTSWPTQLVRWRAEDAVPGHRGIESRPVIAWPLDGQITDERQSDACADQDDAWDPLLHEFMQRRLPGFGGDRWRCMPYTLARLDESRPATAFVAQEVPATRPMQDSDVLRVEYRRERLADRVVDTRSVWTASWIDESTGEPDGVHGPFVQRGEYGLDGRLLRWTTMSNPVEGFGRLVEWQFTWDALGRPVTASEISYWHPDAGETGDATFDRDSLRYESEVTPHAERHFVWTYGDLIALSVRHLRDGAAHGVDDYVYAVAP